MIKVLRHGNIIAVRNPITGKDQKMINVVFTEEGRGGADQKMTQTSEFLSQLAGENVGLSNLRVHTHPVLEEKINLFPPDKEFPGHINRGLYSTPQLRQQESVDPRMIDGKPTYFKTWISNQPEDDLDVRIDPEVLMSANPEVIFNANTRGTEVRIIEQRGGVSAGERRAQPSLTEQPQ